MKIKMKMKEFRIWDCGFRKPSLRSQRLCGKSLRVSEYPTSPEAVVRMGGGGSEGAKRNRPQRRRGRGGVFWWKVEGERWKDFVNVNVKEGC